MTNQIIHNKMKKSKKFPPNFALRLAFLVLLFLIFSCSDDDDDEIGSGPEVSLKTLVEGAALNGANGITIGADGNLYIASVIGQEIIVMDKNSGEIIDRITEGVQSPDDLVFGPDGSLYWTDILLGEVGRRTTDGAVKKQSHLPGVNPIAFNDEGRLFIALDFQGDGLYEFDPELEADPRTIVECPSFPPIPCLGFFNSFDFGPDGRLYGPLFAYNLIISVKVDANNPPTSDPFSDPNLDLQIVAGQNGEFINPVAAKFSPDGLLYVIDQEGKMVKIDIENNNEIIPFTTLDTGLDNMVFDEDGRLFMTNNDNGWVAEILPSGEARVISPGGMIVPQGIAVMRGSNNQDMLFQADLFSMRQFNASTGEQVEQFRALLVPPPVAPSPPAVAFLSFPQNISVSGSNVVISSFFDSSVQIWNPEDGVIEKFADQVVAPIDAVQLNSGEIVVSDLGLGGVISLNDGSMIQPLGAASGLATDGTSVWAADWGTGTIYKIDFDGGTASSTTAVTGLSFPEGLAIDNEGRLLVFETNGPDPSGDSYLTRIDFSSGTPALTTIIDGLETKAGGLPGFPPMWFLDGVDVGSNGDIYLTGGKANEINKIDHSDLE